MPARFRRFLLVGLLVALACQFPLRTGYAESDARLHSASAPHLGGEFDLVDANGRRVTDANFRGKWLLVFFGYTFCPDVCPTTLGVVADVLQMLGTGAAGVQPIFITIDPVRDTPAVLRDYTGHFDSRILGLTGAPEKIADAARHYRVHYKRSGPGEEYTLDHTAALFLIGPDGRYVTQFSHAASADRIARRLAALIDGN